MLAARIRRSAQVLDADNDSGPDGNIADIVNDKEKPAQWPIWRGRQSEYR
jgi:hypothetical protein